MSSRPFRDELHRDTALLTWLRREVNRDLRYWRTEPGAIPLERYAQLVADCRAKLDLLSWAAHWQETRTPEYVRYNYPDRPDVEGIMAGKAEMIMHAMRRLSAGYRDRDGWRQEWEGQ